MGSSWLGSPDQACSHAEISKYFLLCAIFQLLVIFFGWIHRQVSAVYFALAGQLRGKVCKPTANAPKAVTSCLKRVADLRHHQHLCGMRPWPGGFSGARKEEQLGWVSLRGAGADDIGLQANSPSAKSEVLKQVLRRDRHWLGEKPPTTNGAAFIHFIIHCRLHYHSLDATPEKVLPFPFLPLPFPFPSRVPLPSFHPRLPFSFYPSAVV